MEAQVFISECGFVGLPQVNIKRHIKLTRACQCGAQEITEQP